MLNHESNLVKLVLSLSLLLLNVISLLAHASPLLFDKSSSAFCRTWSDGVKSNSHPDAARSSARAKRGDF